MKPVLERLRGADLALQGPQELLLYVGLNDEQELLQRSPHAGTARLPSPRCEMCMRMPLHTRLENGCTARRQTPIIGIRFTAHTHAQAHAQVHMHRHIHMLCICMQASASSRSRSRAARGKATWLARPTGCSRTRRESQPVRTAAYYVLTSTDAYLPVLTTVQGGNVGRLHRQLLTMCLLLCTY